MSTKKLREEVTRFYANSNSMTPDRAYSILIHDKVLYDKWLDKYYNGKSVKSESKWRILFASIDGRPKLDQPWIISDYEAYINTYAINSDSDNKYLYDVNFDLHINSKCHKVVTKISSHEEVDFNKYIIEIVRDCINNLRR